MVLDILTFVSYIALNVDIFLQNRRVLQTKSSRDISIVGVLVRYAAVIIILVKFFALSDWALILGQLAIVANVTTYLYLVFKYRPR